MSAMMRSSRASHLAIVFALLSTFSVESPAQAGDTVTNPPPPIGTLVDVGGYRVHLYCTGTGSPTVVIVGAGYSFFLFARPLRPVRSHRLLMKTGCRQQRSRQQNVDGTQRCDNRDALPASRIGNCPRRSGPQRGRGRCWNWLVAENITAHFPPHRKTPTPASCGNARD